MDTQKLLAAAREAGLDNCSNCGWQLSEANILLALEDAGEGLSKNPEALEHYSFCCPSYTDESGCQGYGTTDREQPAYWIFR